MCFGMQESGKKETSGFNSSSGSNTAQSASTGTSDTTTGQNTTASTTGASNTLGSTVGSTSQNGSTTTVVDQGIKDAALGNLNNVQALQDNGFQAYGGQQVAGFSPDQQASFGLTNAIVGNGTGDKAAGMIDQYAGAGPQNVQAGTIKSQMDPYMSKYVMDALQPQLHQMDVNDAKQMAQVNAGATGSGAFGDARAGIEAANTRSNQALNRDGVIAQAYDKAFNTAIGAGAQDVSNKLSADNANAGYAETAIGRALTGSNALQALQNQQLGVAKTQNEMGGQQTANEQAKLNADYNQYLMAQEYPFKTAQLANQTLATSANALPGQVNTSNTGTTAQNTTGSTTNNQNSVGSQTGTSSTDTAQNTNASGTNQSTGWNTGTTTESKPDNSGWALGGSLLSAFI